MGGRRQKFKKLKPGLYIIGEGLTELYYFKHLKEIFHYTCTIKPRFCDNTCVKQMDDTIAQLVAENVKVICVFDADTSSRNPEEDQVLHARKWAALAPKESISYSKINKAIDLLENNTNPHG